MYKRQAFSVTPEVALVVDGADAADLAGVPAHKQGCSLGGGVVLPYMDQGAIADRGLFEALRSLAESGGIPWQDVYKRQALPGLPLLPR